MADNQRISQLNSLLNAAVSNKNRGEAVYQDAYKRLIKSIEKTINEEQRLESLSRNKTEGQEIDERVKQDFKRKLLEHHSKILKKQMLEKKVAKHIEKERDLEPHISTDYEGYPHHHEETLSESFSKKKAQQAEFKHGLLSQIEEKNQLRQKEALQSDLIDKFRVETAKLSLEKERRLKEEKYQVHLKSLTDAWRRDLEAKELMKNVKRLSKLLNRSTYEREYQWSPSGEPVKELNTGETRNDDEVTREAQVLTGEESKVEPKDDEEEHKEEAQGLEMTEELLEYLRKRSASLAASKAPSVKSKSTHRSERSRSIKSVSNREAYKQLEELEKQEELIRKQKEELIQSISHHSGTARSTSSKVATVSSLMTRSINTPVRPTAEIARQMFKPADEPKPIKSEKPSSKPEDVTQMLNRLFKA